MRIGAAIWRAVKGRAVALPFLLFLGIGTANAFEYTATLNQASFGGAMTGATSTPGGSPWLTASAACDGWIAFKSSASGGGPRTISKVSVQGFFSPQGTATGNLCTVSYLGTTYQVTYAALNVRCDAGGTYAVVPVTVVPQCGGCPVAGTEFPGVAFIGNVNDTITSVPYNGLYCKVEAVASGLCIGYPTSVDPGTVCTDGWSYTGVQGSAPALTQPLRGFTDGKVCSADGKVCAAIGAKDCGSVNGVYRCITSSPAPGGCVSSATATVCTANTSNPLVNPPAPGTSTNPASPGLVTPPIAVIGKPAGMGAGGYVGGQTVNVWGPGGAGGTPPTSGTADPSTEQPNTEPCGGPTQPKCNVKIDETGIDAGALDTSFRGTLNAAKTAADAEEVTAAAALANQAAASSPAAGWAPSLPSMAASSCQTINIEFFGGATKPFPPPYLCSALENYIKPLLAFFLYVITAGLILFSGIRSMTGNT